jgi:predicted nucleic acid-binding protein
MYVIDASVYVSRLKATEVDHASSKRLLNALQAQRIPVSCPNLVWPEVAAAVARGTQDPTLGLAAAVTLRRLPFHVYVPLDNRLASSAAELAAKCGLRGVDAVYVALAQRLNCTLVTLDDEQRNRAAGSVTTYSPDQVLSLLPSSTL